MSKELTRADGLSVQNDKTMNMDVFDGMEGKLTQTHIDKGRRDLCRECPVALCISDLLAEHKEVIGEVLVEVGAKQVRLHTGEWDAPFLVAALDRLLEEWVKQFDAGNRVPTGKVYIKKDGFIKDVEGQKIQRWRCGIEFDNA